MIYSSKLRLKDYHLMSFGWKERVFLKLCLRGSFERFEILKVSFHLLQRTRGLYAFEHLEWVYL